MSVSKAHVDYWKKRLRKPRFTRHGQREKSPNWAVSIQYAGLRREWSLGTPNKEVAAAKARDIYLSLIAHGWEVTQARYRPVHEARTEERPVTVGDFLAEVRAKADARPDTVELYSKCFRKIVSDIIGLPDSPKKRDHRCGGRAAWLAQVCAVPLAEITPGRVQAWKRAFVGKAGGDPLRERQARSSVNGYLLGARALFSEKHTRHFAFPCPGRCPSQAWNWSPSLRPSTGAASKSRNSSRQHKPSWRPPIRSASRSCSWR